MEGDRVGAPVTGERRCEWAPARYRRVREGDYLCALTSEAAPRRGEMTTLRQRLLTASTTDSDGRGTRSSEEARHDAESAVSELVAQPPTRRF
jgi:hypothetical protein